MIVTFRLRPLIWLTVFGAFVGLSPATWAQRDAPPTKASPTDERAAQVAERYHALLQANPTEGVALDRLWKYHEEHGTTGELLKGYREAADAANAQMPTLLIYGHLLKKTGQLPEAASAYERAGKLFPASPLPALAMGDLASPRGLFDEAAEHYAEALRKLPDGDRRRPDLLLKRGGALLAAGRSQEAADAWEQVVTINPGDFALRRRLAEAYESNGLPELAVGQHRYIATHGNTAEAAAAARDLGRLYEAQGQFDPARDALEDGLLLTARDNWLHGDLQTRLIRLYQRADRTDELTRRWREAVEKAPRDLGGYLRLAALAEAEGDLSAQRAALEQIVVLNPRDRESTLKLAACLAQAGDRAHAAGLYDTLLKTQPGNVGWTLARADLDVQLGQPQEAVRRVEARVAQSPADESVTGPALEFFLKNRLDGPAEKLLRAEVERSPTAAAGSLALAKFLFSQRRTADARAALEALAAQPGEPADRANRLAEVAEAYRQAGCIEDAFRIWQAVRETHPADPAPLLAQAELSRGVGDTARASALLEAAAALSDPGTDRLAAERKLFDLLRAQSPNQTAPGTFSGSQRSGAPNYSPALRDHLAALTADAEQRKTADGYVRLARWLAWAHDEPGVVAATDKALALQPGDVAALGLAADAALALGQPDRVERLLADIVKADPPADAALRRLAELKLSSGNPEEALQLFERLQAAAPGSRAALVDLANAQQRADRWFDALNTWEQSYALPGATPVQKAEIRRPLLAAYEHVGQFSKAVEVLLQAMDEPVDAETRQDLLRQLVSLGHQHGLETRLTEGFEARLHRRPDDYFTLTALAQLRREAGEPVEAFALLRKAHFSAPDPAQSLRALVQEAEALGNTGDAVHDQQRLVILPGQGTVENLGKLAGLQSADQTLEEAARTWEEVATRFPRDPGALLKAAAFFDDNGQLDRARQLTRATVALDGADFSSMQRLAALDARASDLSAALADYEAILALTSPEAPGKTFAPPEELRLPFDPLAGMGSGAGRFRLRGLGPGPATTEPVPSVADGDSALRLEAITAISRLLFPNEVAPPQAMEAPQVRWLARWQAAADAGVCNEAFFAFYFAGDKARTMEMLRRWQEKAPSGDGTLPGAFVLAGLRLGDYSKVGEWVWSGSEDVLNRRVQTLAAGLDRFLSTGGKPEPALISGVFPDRIDRQGLLWDAAKEFAGLHWYTAAAALGERAIKLKTGEHGVFATQVAEWEIYAGATDRARETLRIEVEGGGGWTFDSNLSSTLSAVRQYYFLLPAAERPAFVSRYLPRACATGQPLPGILAGVLLHGLSGDEAAACRDVDALLATRMVVNDNGGPSADARRWAYLLTNGVQLQSWNLDSLAVYLWRRALDEAGGFDRQFGDSEGTLAEIRRRLLGEEVALAPDPEAARTAVAAYLETGPPSGTATGMAGEMMNNARYAAAIQIFEYLCRLEPGDPEHWRSLFSAYEAVGSPDRMERALAGLLEADAPLPEGLARADFVGRWAAAREACGDADGACRVLEKERAMSPGSLPVLMQLAQTYARSKRFEQAAAVWREMLPLDPNATALLGLANVEEQQGHLEAARSLLRDGLEHGSEPGRNEAATRLFRLDIATGRTEEARGLARNLLKAGRLDPMPVLAANLAAAGQAAAGRELLATAVPRAHEPEQRCRLQQALVSFSPAAGSDPRSFLRGIARLETFARSVPALRNSFEAVEYKLARGAGADAALEADLRRRWQDGKGNYYAGERLATLYLATGCNDRLRKTISQFDHRPMLPDQLLFGLEKALVQAGQAPLALPISERLCRRFPQNMEYALGRVAALWKAGRQPEAKRAMDALADTAGLNDSVLENIALLSLSLGDQERARQFFERVVGADPSAAHSPGSFLQLARLSLDAGRNEEAGALLANAYRQDAVTDFSPLVDFLARSGQLKGDAALRMPVPDFPLSFPRRAALLAAVSERLTKDGRAVEGRELLLRHAAFLAEIPTTAAGLCGHLTDPEKTRLKACLQIAVGQMQPPYPRLQRLLGMLDPGPFDPEGMVSVESAPAMSSPP